MRYSIVLLEAAQEDIARFGKYDRTVILDCLERFLRHEPTLLSRSRIKRLRGRQAAEYRLRVGSEIRVFYQVEGEQVLVMRVMTKRETMEFYREDEP